MSASIELEEQVITPGDKVRGWVTLQPSSDEVSARVELSVLWETSGKGDTDRGVVQNRVLCDGDPEAARATHAFEAAIPLLPLSHEGILVTIKWIVRVRRVATLGEDTLVDAPFTVAWPR